MAALLTLFRHATRPELPVPDSELLDRFAVGRDEQAFAELVRRHGPVVYRICRRLVGPSAADDAFQATFLVLATRLDAARTAGSLGGWLVGVAGRVARQLRRSAARRTRHETTAAAARLPQDADHPIDLADQFRVLDEELARLPARLRDPVVLCLLQGRTQEEAARELGRDARTLRRRLERAKKVLRTRLERRGVVPAVAAGLVASAGSVSAGVPSELSTRTVSTVFDFLTGGAKRLAPVILAKGVATSMFTRKLTHLMAVAAAGLIGVGVVLADDTRPIPAPRATQATPVTAPAAVVPPLPAAHPAAPTVVAPVRRGGTSDERMIQIQAVCIQAPAGSCERIGVAEENESAGAWTLSRRETRMLNALIRAEKEKGSIEIHSRPQLTCLDNQTGFVQIGQDVPYTSSKETVRKDGIVEKVSKISNMEVGTKLRVTPKIAADGKFIQLALEMHSIEVSGTAVKLGNGLTTPSFHSQSVKMSVILPDGGTVVQVTTSKDGAGKATETLWVLTAHLVDGKANPAARGAKRPQAVMPPQPAPPAAVEPPGMILPSPAPVPGTNSPVVPSPPPASPPAQRRPPELPPIPAPIPADQSGPVRAVPPSSPGEAAPVLPGRRP